MINNGIPHNANNYLQKQLPVEALANSKENKNAGKIKTFLHKGMSKKRLF